MSLDFFDMSMKVVFERYSGGALSRWLADNHHFTLGLNAVVIVYIYRSGSQHTTLFLLDTLTSCDYR